MIPVHDDNPTHLRPWVTWALIGACVLTFLWQATADEAWARAIVAGLGATPEVIFGGEGALEDPAWVPRLTRSYKSSMSSGNKRMHPWLDRRPTPAGLLVPWMR